MYILLADDHTLVREGIKVLLAEAYPFAEISVVSDASEMADKLPQQKWDVIISDISMPPGNSGIESIKLVKEHHPKTPVIILSMHPVDEYAVRAIKAGASGYLNKKEAGRELIKAVNYVLTGKKYLSAEVALVMADTFENGNDGHSVEKLSNRELEVFKLLASGITVSGISKRLGLRNNTVSTFRSKIFEKMNFTSNLELVKYAVDHQLT